jgi:hypothetical protein
MAERVPSFISGSAKYTCSASRARKSKVKGFNYAVDVKALARQWCKLLKLMPWFRRTEASDMPAMRQAASKLIFKK